MEAEAEAIKNKINGSVSGKEKSMEAEAVKKAEKSMEAEAVKKAEKSIKAEAEAPGSGSF